MQGVSWADLWMVASWYEGVGGSSKANMHDAADAEIGKSCSLSGLFNNTKVYVNMAD